jgi:hypothetical protein
MHLVMPALDVQTASMITSAVLLAILRILQTPEHGHSQTRGTRHPPGNLFKLQRFPLTRPTMHYESHVQALCSMYGASGS